MSEQQNFQGQQGFAPPANSTNQHQVTINMQDLEAYRQQIIRETQAQMLNQSNPSVTPQHQQVQVQPLQVEIPSSTPIDDPESTFRYDSGYVASFQPVAEEDTRESATAEKKTVEEADSDSSSLGSRNRSRSSSGPSRKSSTSSDSSQNQINTQETLAEGTVSNTGEGKSAHNSRSRTRAATPHTGHCSCCITEVLALDKYPEGHPIRRGIPQLFNPAILAELTEEDPILNQLCKAVRHKDFDKFTAADKSLSHFYAMAQEKDGILIIDNRIAIPTKLRNVILNWLHRDHPGQLAMVDAANYLWWPKMHSAIIEKAEDCSHCRKIGKNLKPLTSKKDFDKIESPVAANDEVQLDFAGPLFYNDSKSKTYLLVAVDSYSRFPSVAIVKSTGSAKIIKFLK